MSKHIPTYIVLKSGMQMNKVLDINPVCSQTWKFEMWSVFGVHFRNTKNVWCIFEGINYYPRSKFSYNMHNII